MSEPLVVTIPHGLGKDEALRRIKAGFSRRTSVSDLINSIDIDREHGNLSSALRLFVLNHYQARPVSK